MRNEIRRETEALWSIEDVAEYLAVPVQSIDKMIAERRIPHLLIGEHLRFRKADIDRWLDLLVVPCQGQALRPASVDTPIAPTRHRDCLPEAPLSVSQSVPPSRPSPSSLSQAAKKSPAVPAPRADKVYTFKGYTVRVRYQQVDPADQEHRSRMLVETIAKSLLREKKEGGS